MLTTSIILRLNDSSVPNGASVSDFVKLSERTNFLMASGTIPLLRIASSVGNLGSSYPDTLPS